MNRPPLWMHVKIKNAKGDFGLWLPLFLLLPLALVILLILAPLILIALIVLWPSGWGEWALQVLWAAVASFWSMRGLKVDIRNGNEYVHVSVV